VLNCVWFEKYHTGLEAVTETVDSTDLGKLMTYIKGYAAKLEAEKIRDRSIRGRKVTVKAGRMPGGFILPMAMTTCALSKANAKRTWLSMEPRHCG
jgi:hypothetical protein